MGSRRWDSVKKNYTDSTTPDVDSFLAWVQDLDTTLLSIGLVRETTSLGSQWDLSPQAVPTGNVYTLFRIYELNDSLSGTLPIYIKLWFGGSPYGTTFPTSAHLPQCKVQIGTTVTSLGVLGGLVTEELLNFNTVSGGSGGVFSSSSSPNYCHKSDVGLFLFLGGSPINIATLIAFPALMFYLERLPDANGNPTTNGYTIVRPTQWTSIDGGALGPVGLAPIARTYTPAFDLGSWHGTPCAPLGGAITATIDGGINFQPFYHICPELRPMRGIFGYYSEVMTLYSNTDLTVAGGAAIQVIALGGDAASGRRFYGMLVDPYDTNFLLAAVTD